MKQKYQQQQQITKKINFNFICCTYQKKDFIEPISNQKQNLTYFDTQTNIIQNNTQSIQYKQISSSFNQQVEQLSKNSTQLNLESSYNTNQNNSYIKYKRNKLAVIWNQDTSHYIFALIKDVHIQNSFYKLDKKQYTSQHGLCKLINQQTLNKSCSFDDNLNQVYYLLNNLIEFQYYYYYKVQKQKTSDLTNFNKFLNQVNQFDNKITQERLAQYIAFKAYELNISTVVDALAGIGSASIQFAKRCDMVISFEENQNRCANLKRNCDNFDIWNKIDVINANYLIQNLRMFVDLTFIHPEHEQKDFLDLFTDFNPPLQQIIKKALSTSKYLFLLLPSEDRINYTQISTLLNSINFNKQYVKIENIKADNYNNFTLITLGLQLRNDNLLDYLLKIVQN